MTEELAEGPCYALQISGCGGDIREDFRQFVGPIDPVNAQIFLQKKNL